MSINQAKYQETILYLCQQLKGKINGKKKLAKLLYFADFDCFEKNHAPITGDDYKKLPMGPFPIFMDSITAEMEQAGLLQIEKITERAGYNPTEIYCGNREPDVAIFSAEEKQMLDRIIVKYGHLNGKQLEELSHAEAPYIASKLSQDIPYELAYYRDTDFNE